MTPGEEDGLERGGDDLLAAEYVLGVLPAQERDEATRRIEHDAEFARLVEAWEERLSPLNAGYGEVDPPASVKAALDARLFATRGATPLKPGLLQSLAFWRGVAAAALAALLLVITLPFLQPPPAMPTAERLVASLASEETDVRYLVVYDAHAGEIGLSHVTGDREAGRDFELWVIEGDDPPASLGVIPVGANVHLLAPSAVRQKISTGALFAISLEPGGGSPTGQPTGPVVAAGDLRSI